MPEWLYLNEDFRVLIFFLISGILFYFLYLKIEKWLKNKETYCDLCQKMAKGPMLTIIDKKATKKEYNICTLHSLEDIENFTLNLLNQS